ncbi:MAG: hypothetical protein VB070_09780 [Clostridiaceae bacterium]|nr:hypothetical protein [Clostridiaceae bacterium]
MNGLSTELRQRMEEAGKDAAWVEKVRAAADWDVYAALLAEKGIEAPAELKKTFSAGCASKTGKLDDDELENVSGGWKNIFECPREYNGFLCESTFCPHAIYVQNTPDIFHYRKFCDQGYWAKDYTY